jgi:hypothetical protein
MRILLALALILPVLAPAPVSAGPKASEFSAQRYERPRIRVYPQRGRLLYRDCVFRLVQEWRPSGAVIVPRQHCWWVRG